jgi:hypothetical protein
MSHQTDNDLTLPYAYLVSLTTHQMLYQKVIVESEHPLSEEEAIQRALKQPGGEWEPGPIDETPDVDSIQLLRQKEQASSDSSEHSSSCSIST